MRDALAYSVSVGVTTNVDMGGFILPGTPNIQNSFMFDSLASFDPFTAYDPLLALHEEGKLSARVRLFYLTPGVWNVVNGGRTVVNAMLDHTGHCEITFVGSTPTGRDVIYKKDVGRRGKELSLNEMPQNFMTIMPDCDVDRTIAAMVTSFFGNAGQRCLAAANAVVVGDDDNFYRNFVDRVIAQASKIKIGYTGTQHGNEL